MKYTKALCHFLLLMFSLESSEFDKYQTLFTEQEISFRLQNYLIKDAGLEDHFLLTSDAFYLYADKNDKINQKAEFILKLALSPQKKEQTAFPKTLNNLRIAIDPGHLGGDFAFIEQRYIKMPKNGPPTIFFSEGNLTLLTALLLKQWFENEGSIVLLTKDQFGQSVYEKNFYEWLKEDGPKLFSGIENESNLNQSLSQIFTNHYNRLDLAARAKKINAFKPHLTLILHYNAHGIGDTNHHTEDYNYNMVFIGGGFRNGELSTKENRNEFLRLLLTDHIDHSLQLSTSIINEMADKLQVSAVTSEDPVPYLITSSKHLNNGIYARNLFLTRMVNSPLCYGETLCQNHKEECLRLNERRIIIRDLQGPKRVEQVAQAYFLGVKHFIEGKSE